MKWDLISQNCILPDNFEDNITDAGKKMRSDNNKVKDKKQWQQY